MPGLSVSPRASLSATSNAPTAGNPWTTLPSEPSLPIPTLAGHPMPPSSRFSTTSRPPAEQSSFFTTSTIFRSKKPQLFSTFLSAPPSHVSIMESRHFANISLSKGNHYEPRIPTAQLRKYERRNRLRPTGSCSRRQVGTLLSNHRRRAWHSRRRSLHLDAPPHVPAGNSGRAIAFVASRRSLLPCRYFRPHHVYPACHQGKPPHHPSGACQHAHPLTFPTDESADRPGPRSPQ